MKASTTLDMADVALGDSIATNGVCLTVTDMGSDYYCADVSAETIKLTGFAHYGTGSTVNLEKALSSSRVVSKKTNLEHLLVP